MPGVPTTPDDLILPPAEALREAQRLLDGGRPFHAHEVLEAAWKAAGADEREFWRGMAQLAVGLTHARRGNTAGAARLLRRSADRINDYAAAPPHGVPVAALAAWARETADRIGRDAEPLSDQALTPTLVAGPNLATAPDQPAAPDQPPAPGQPAAPGQAPAPGQTAAPVRAPRR
jgi:hypothetical protein